MVRRALPVAALAALVSCDDGTFADRGLDAELRVEGATFRRGALPDGAGGPAVKGVSLAPRIVTGTVGACTGSLDPSATAVVLALDGDRGYWTLPAAIPDVSAPGFPTFSSRIGLSSAAREGARTLVVHAVDEGGRVGPAATRPVTVTHPAPAEGSFVVSLVWSGEADLDLLVAEPGGAELSKRTPSTRDAGGRGGLLDADKNARCTTDGRAGENVVYLAPPASGRYVARVDTFSLCGRESAPYRVEARRDGVLLAATEGTATALDTRLPHDRGAGIVALEVDVP